MAKIKPSKKLQQLVVLIHAIALAASFTSTLPLLAKWIVALCVGLHFKLTFPKFQPQQRQLRYSEKRGWELSEGGGFEQAEILNSSILTTFVIFLHFRNKPAIVIANDALNESDYRQLLVKLKMTAD